MSNKSRSKSSSKSGKELVANFDPKIFDDVRLKGYEVKDKVGAGGCGTVFKILCTRNDKLAAAKVIDLDRISDKIRQKYIPREIETLINSQHENLIGLFDILLSNEKVYIFMELAANGDISAYARKHNGIKVEFACQWFMQVFKGLQFMHNVMNTVHRDIKTDNMLLDDKFIAKLADFGYSKYASFDHTTDKVLMSSTFCGTLPFKSVQMLEHKRYNAFKTDIWSMGVTFFFMFHSIYPFDYTEGLKEMIKHMQEHPAHIRGLYKANLPQEANQLVESMLNPNEEERASVNDLVCNFWLQSSCN